MKQAERNTAAFGSRIQNVSFQVSDFAVQVSSGTDATRALAQQLPQLLGGLGVFGAVAGAAAAILLPLVASLVKTRDYAKELADGLGKLDDAQKITNTSLVDLTEQYGRYARVISEVAKTQEALAKDDITNTRDRLMYVAKMTEQAAQRVLNATDAAAPLQEATAS